MKNSLSIIILSMLISCNHPPNTGNKKISAKKTSADTTDKHLIQYSDHQIESFLDSVGHLPTKPIADKEAFWPDSIFKNQRSFDTLISLKDFNILRRAIRKGAISVSTAKRIFNNPTIDSVCTEKSIFLDYKTGLTPIEYYPFGKSKNAYDEYAICIGDPSHCEDACLYFFKGKKIIAMHNFDDRYAPGLWHYKDSDGRTVVYYIYMFNEGSGEWWFNYFFYKYDGDKLIPVLNELENGNISAPVARAFWLESAIQKTNPLTIKMVYYDQFPDENTDDFGPKVVSDSTLVSYVWDEHSKMFKGQYASAKINKAQILSYYLSGNNLLFINSNYSSLKAALHNKAYRKRTLDYLNKIKNHPTE